MMMGGVMRAQRAACRRESIGAPLRYIRLGGVLSVELWHTLLGIAQAGGAFADTWTGQIRAVVTQAPSGAARPPYTTDGTAFGGKSVVQANATGKGLAASGIATLLATGTRPWGFVRGRHRAAGANNTLVDFGVLGVSDDMDVRQNSGGTALEVFFNGPTVAGPALVTAVQSQESFLDGSNANLVVDGTVYQTASAASLGHNITAIGIGRAASGSYHYGSTSIAIIYVRSAHPGAAIVKAFYALAAAEFPA